MSNIHGGRKKPSLLGAGPFREQQHSGGMSWGHPYSGGGRNERMPASNLGAPPEPFMYPPQQAQYNQPHQAPLLPLPVMPGAPQQQQQMSAVPPPFPHAGATAGAGGNTDTSGRGAAAAGRGYFKKQRVK